MPQKRGEVIEEVDEGPVARDIYEVWIGKQVEAKSRSLANQEEKEDEEEDEIDRAEDVHEKAHRRKKGKGSAASGGS
jgi:hypothetical protein